MGFPLSITGSVSLPSNAHDLDAVFAALEMALRPHRPREVRREGLDLTFKSGFPTLARRGDFFEVIDSGHLFVDATRAHLSIGFELRLGTLVLSTAMVLLFIGALALTGRVTAPLNLGLFVSALGATSAGCYLWAFYGFKGFLNTVASGTPGRRLEPERRKD